MENLIDYSNLKVKRDVHWADLTEQYLRHLSFEIDSITKLIEDENFNSLQKKANSMKYSACTYQLKEIAQCIEKLEIQAKNQSTEDVLIAVDELIRAITGEIQQLNKEIREQLEDSFTEEFN